EASIQAFPEIFVEVYSPTIRQALFLSNGKALADLLLVEDGNLLDRLRTLSGHDERVREAFLSCFGRSPDEEERRIAVEYLAARENRLEDALSHVVWSLVTSAEFQLNH
ncbi:MAG TPA: hypothetical protein VK116_13750, partial [Planctomycetota bacterium]|nr:hypothetical protein [Planctomycetota bacterium]